MNRIRAMQLHSPSVTPWDPSPVFILKTLLYPMTAAASLGVSLWLRHEPFQHVYFLVGVLAFFATADFLDVAPLQRTATRARLPLGLIHVTFQWLIVIGFLWALISLSGLRERLDDSVLLMWAVITPPMLWLSQLAAQLVIWSGGERGTGTRNAVIIGRNELGLLLASRLREDRSLRLQVLGYFDDVPRVPGTACSASAACHAGAGSFGGTALPDLHGGDILGDPAQLPEFIARNDVHVVYITWPLSREARILELLAVLRDSTVSVYFVPDVSVASLIQARVDLVNGIPVVGVCESPFYGIRGLTKRTSDIVLAGALLILFCPLLVGICIGVRLSSPGPVIFRQRRYGLDGKEITVYKFRSMTVTEDGDRSYTQVTRNDRRVTAFGAFLRRTSLDELPQLINVLEGSMSLVGPRPHAIAVNETYRRLISGYMVRHKVKPGITGWAQINGFRGGDDLESMRGRIEHDLEYLRNWSLGLDLAILLKTIALVWADRRAY